MSETVEQFFLGYVDAFDRSLGETVDVEGIRAHFIDCFIAAGPAGMRRGEINDEFAEALRQEYAIYRSVGGRTCAGVAECSPPT